MTYKELKDHQQAEINAFPFIWAFNEKQLADGMRKLGLNPDTDKDKLCSIGGGGIIRKECQSFTNHGHDKTPPTVFNPLSLWLTLPRDMGGSHTLWPPSITRAIPACLRFAQGLHKAQKNQNNRAVI